MAHVERPTDSSAPPPTPPPKDAPDPPPKYDSKKEVPYKNLKVRLYDAKLEVLDGWIDYVLDEFIKSDFWFRDILEKPIYEDFHCVFNVNIKGKPNEKELATRFWEGVHRLQKYGFWKEDEMGGPTITFELKAHAPKAPKPGEHPTQVV